MTLVVDASALVAALVDDGDVGRAALAAMEDEHLVAPHAMPVEVANVLRRAAAAGQLSDDLATLAHADLLELPIELYPYEPFAARVWELRRNVAAYDAWYVAVAEGLEAPLLSLDRRLAAAPGPRCEFLVL